MKLFRIVLVMYLLTLAVSVGAQQANNSIYIQARVFIDSKADFVQLRQMGLDIVDRGDNYLEIITHADQLQRIEDLGIKTEIIHNDVSAFFRSRLPEKSMGAYRTLSEIYAYIDSIIAAHPTIISAKVKIGETYEGRDLWAFKISDNPNVDEDEPEVLYTSAIHCREVITPEVLMYFINYLADNYGTDQEVTDIVDNRELWFVLVVNPDGYHHNEVTDPDGGGMWRKNYRPNGDGTYGVDLNRNFGYEWGFDDVGSSPTTSLDTYRGPSAFSEKETQAMRDFAIAHNFIISIYYHSYSNFILYPWGYDRLYTPDNDIFTSVADSIHAMNNYAPGTPWSLLYTANGVTDDWHYGEQTLKNKTFALTMEVGSSSDGFWPPASRINALVSENLAPNLFLASIAGDIYKLKAPLTPQLSVADTVSADSYTVYWSLNDTINPGVAYELKEYQGLSVITNNGSNFSNITNNGFTVSMARYASPSSSFFSTSSNNLIAYMQSSEPYHVQSGDSLTFQTWYDIESDWDYAYVEISTDGNIFSPIQGNITTESNPNNNNRGHGITGTSTGGWVDASFDLSDYTGQDVYFRFSYYTDSYTYEEGIYIDDIYPFVTFTHDSTITTTDTSYTFANRDVGDYYYKVRGRDAENQWSQFSALQMTYVKTSVICGDVNGDGSINIGDAVYLINYVFKSGPEPASMNAADANGDGDVNVADAVYLINYVFKGGPSPNCQ